MKWNASLLVGVMFTTAIHFVSAEEQIEVVLEGLKNPCGVAVQPDTGVVFVSDSAAGRIIRVVDGAAQEVVAGSTIGQYGKGPIYDIGPLGITFLDKNQLVVGDGGYADGEEHLRIFNVPETGQPALAYDDSVKVGPLTGTDDIKAEGNLYGVAATATAIYVTCNGDDTKGWVSKTDREGTQFGGLTRFIATKEATEVDAPVGITISPRGEVVIGQMGEINVKHDSLLTFYNANTGKMLGNRATGLHDITALAYSDKGHLYALDFAWAALEEGGLYRLDDDGDGGVNAEKITNLDKPTAMAFGADGSLYITVIGSVEKEQQVGQGKLVRLQPGL